MRCTRILASLGAAVLVALAGCGVQPSGVIYGISPPSGAAEGRMPIEVYFLLRGELFPIARDDTPRFPADSLAQLAAGPTAAERARGLRNEVPAEAAPFTVTTDDAGRAVVTVSVPPSQLSTVAAEQIACTATGGSGAVLLLGEGPSRQATCTA
ncbi:hypothetical protein [Prauserella cavernicola]|uniref:GerMN domain-containing protein n=1 Tax=Prauserella cavernicola TaxID=2800127 RepID=A0A934QQQ4_9PSEU|nr:hypothetical protein [Prauserella cavernicola]MBK1783674.1 hypothetical protein [Prauserella cavernicola]